MKNGGGRDLQRLLAALEPRLLPEEFVFCTVAHGQGPSVANLPALATCAEEEGLSLVLERGLADRRGLRYGPVMRCISLQVHSSLEAVGLTAAVSGKLAEAGISANVIAAYHHDHILVPTDRALEALEALEVLGRVCEESTPTKSATRI